MRGGAGELEVVARIARRSLSSTDQLYLVTRHFVWLAPLVDLVLFLGLGLVLAVFSAFQPRFGKWLGPRLLIGFGLLPLFPTAGRGVYPEAWLVLSLEISSRLAPVLERLRPAPGRWLAATAALAGLVALQGASIVVMDGLKQSREDHRPPPAAGSPNILLIVLDTVRADHLSLYGYERPTTPNLARLAQRGVRFEQARAAAPWTPASHATRSPVERPTNSA